MNLHPEREIGEFADRDIWRSPLSDAALNQRVTDIGCDQPQHCRGIGKLYSNVRFKPERLARCEHLRLSRRTRRRNEAGLLKLCGFHSALPRKTGSRHGEHERFIDQPGRRKVVAIARQRIHQRSIECAPTQRIDLIGGTHRVQPDVNTTVASAKFPQRLRQQSRMDSPFGKADRKLTLAAIRKRARLPLDAVRMRKKSLRLAQE